MKLWQKPKPKHEHRVFVLKTTEPQTLSKYLQPMNNGLAWIGGGLIFIGDELKIYPTTQIGYKGIGILHDLIKDGVIEERVE